MNIKYFFTSNESFIDNELKSFAESLREITDLYDLLTITQ